MKSSPETRSWPFWGPGCGPYTPKLHPWPRVVAPSWSPNKPLCTLSPLNGLLLQPEFTLSPLNCQSAACAVDPTDRSLHFFPPQAEKPISVSWQSASEPPPNFPNLFFSSPRDHKTISSADPCRSRSDGGETLQDTSATHLSPKCPNQILFVPCLLISRRAVLSLWCGFLSRRRFIVLHLQT